MSLTVFAEGQTYNEIRNSAAELGSAFYEVNSKCLIVTVGQVYRNVEWRNYGADCTVSVAHDFNNPAYGFPKCFHCGITRY